MSILNYSDNFKVGSSQVSKVYSETTRVWPATLWNFDAPSNGDKLSVNVEPTAEINWGDGNTETLPNDTEILHTYTTGFSSNSFYFSIPGTVESFKSRKDPGAPGEVAFEGTFNAAALPNLDDLQVRSHGITDILGVDQATNITVMDIVANELDGDIKQYMPPNIEEFQIQFNPIDQPIPNDTLAEFTALRIIATSGNSNMGGSFPTFSTSIKQIDFGACGMSGDLPSLTSYTNLNRLWIYTNNFGVPSGWVVPASITSCLFSSNSLTSTEVNRALVAFDNAGASNGSLNLGGNNATPTGAGITAKNSLISKGWSLALS